MYGDGNVQSIRGNCSEPDAATALGLSTRANSLPLKPRQCLLLFPDTLFTIIEDSIWIDNLYLKSHQPRLQPDIQDPAFIRVGLSNFLWERMQADLVLDTPNGQGGVFLTNITFEAPPHPNLLGVSTGFELFQVYLSDCIFTGWRGSLPPVAALHLGVVHLVDTVFHDIDLHAELVDVSGGGIAIFEDVLLADVDLSNGQIVATGDTDYGTADVVFGDIMYSAYDDSAFDVPVEDIPPAARGPFGANRIVNGVMSNCVYLVQDALMPGCPAEALEARDALLAIGLANANPSSKTPADYEPGEEWTVTDQLKASATLRLQNNLTATTAWFVLTKEAVGPLAPPPPLWPDFEDSLRALPPPAPRVAPSLTLWPNLSGPSPQLVRGGAAADGGTGLLMVSVCSALAGAVLLCVLGALWVLLRRRRKLEEQAKAARVGAWHTLRAQRGHRRDASGSGHSSLSMVQSRKVEVPETTQMLISTGNTSTGLVPGFTAHAQGSAAWSDRSDSPLATNLYVTSSGKLPPAFEVPPRGPSQSQSAMLPAQCSLPSAARSASTEPASHSAGSDLMHAAVLSGPGAVGCTSCALSGQTLTGGNSCWTLPPASVFNSLGIPKSLSGGSPRGHLGGMCRGDSVQRFAEMDAARVVQDSNELATVASATGGDAHSILPSALGSAPEGMWDNVNAARRVELARLGAPRGIHSCAALSRAASSPCAVVRPPDTAQGLAGFVQADADSQRNAQGHDASANGHASADLADGPCTTVPPLGLVRNLDSRSTPSGGGKLQRVCSLGGAWEGVLRHDRSASDSDPARHALVTPRIPYTVGMEAVSRSGSIGHATSQGIADITDSSAATGSGQFARGRSPSRHEDGRAPDSVTLRQLTDTAESSTAGVGSSQGIAAQWQGLSQSLWRGRGMLADSAGPSRLLREVGDTVAEASWQPLAPDIDIGDVGGTGALDGDPCMRRLCRQLDSFRDSDVFLGRFRMLGRQQRRHGGQAVVQFAEGPTSACEYAVKFFLDADAFHAEAALYAACTFSPLDSNRASSVGASGPAFAAGGGAASPELSPSPLATPREDADADSSVVELAVTLPVVAAGGVKARGRFLPQVEAVCAGGGMLVDPRGRPLPPCIVMERGESLQDWSERAEPDLFTSLAVLSNLSKRLADMHDAGYVHRDLKPANVMWLPRENRWTVIDFGCAARIGSTAPLNFTLAYAAPEVVLAFEAHCHNIRATPALDAWSLGIMAFELLTGVPAFRMLTDGRAKVMARLRGDLPLPWEAPVDRTQRRRLGAFRQPVLQLLERDPARRISMRRFHETCTKLFGSVSTVVA